MKDIEFEANIVELGTNEKGNFVVIDNSLFYPDGKGGSIGDRGTIGNSKVIGVEETEGKISHFVDKWPDYKSVLCTIDYYRRQDLSIQHTAQHIISQALIKVANVETVSFHMGEAVTTIDIDTPNITQEMIDTSELLANEVVLENRIVKKYFVQEGEIEKLNFRKKIDVEGPIRIVEVEGFDISMCGGMHVDATGEIGLIKIIKSEHFKKTLTRLYFIAGKRALLDYQKKAKILKEISENLTTGEDELLNKINLLENEENALLKENKKLKEESLKNTAKDIFEKGYSVLSRRVSIYELPFLSKEEAGILARFLQAYINFASLAFVRNDSLFAILTFSEGISVDIESLKKNLQNLTSGRVWGNKGLVFLDCKKEFFEEIEKIFLSSF
jgi:alanyl-tRNA synthetase